MTTVARRDPADKAKIDAIEAKLLANPEIAKLIDELGMSTTDANDLVRGMLQASISFIYGFAVLPSSWASATTIVFTRPNLWASNGSRRYTMLRVVR